MTIRKRWWGVVVGLLVFLSLATTTAALYWPRARWNGMRFATTNLGLQISREDSDSPTDQSFATAVDQYSVDTLVPGGSVVQTSFWVKNLSSRLTMDLTGQVLIGQGDWAVLKDVIQISVADYGQPNDVTPWLTLAQWQENPQIFPGGSPVGTINALTQRRYILRVRAADKYPDGGDVGEELFNKATDGVTFLISGQEHVGTGL